MQKGRIRVETENIFPIIKKFLYSDPDIFLRELVSNAIDATQKLKAYASSGEAKGELGDLRVEVSIDEKKKTITISDNGVGMTAEEVDKYINQVAFSSAEEFLAKYKGQQDANIIGHFGLGFYSAFMVSDRVEIRTLSYREGSKGVRWECDGSPEYVLEEKKKKERGTDIILHLNEESGDFLDKYRIKGILEKFCRFLPVAIHFDGSQVNNTTPAWVRKPSELTDEDYRNFYKELYPANETPLFWIHLNVDYPFNLTGILYFPRIRQSYEVQKDRIQLYCNQVFVTDEVKDIVPEFLMLLQGVIDSPDIPLNVSRSYLQGDPNVRKINSHITKKVADKLEEIFNAERPAFQEKWESLGLFIKYGMITDDKFRDRAEKFHIMQEARSGAFHTFEEYRALVSERQTDKEGKLTIIYTTDPVQQDAHIRAAEDKGYKVVRLDTLVDASFINHMEGRMEKVRFTRVDADIADNLVDVQEAAESVLSASDATRLKEMFSFPVEGLKLNVEVKGLSPQAPPVVATRPEFMRRMKDMASMSGPMGAFYASMEDEVAITVNGNHPIFKGILSDTSGEMGGKRVRTLADMALLSQGLLKGAALTEFIERNVELIAAGTAESPAV